MTRTEVFEMVESIGLPCAYYQFNDNTPQKPPFVVWFFSSDDDFVADNENYTNIEVLNIELYTYNKDFELDAVVEQVLKENGFVWSKESSFIESEKIWQTAYESEVIINGEE